MLTTEDSAPQAPQEAACVQHDILALFNETKELSEPINRVLGKYKVALMNYTQKLRGSCSKFSYLAIMVLLDRFTIFMDA